MKQILCVILFNFLFFGVAYSQSREDLSKATSTLANYLDSAENLRNIGQYNAAIDVALLAIELSDNLNDNRSKSIAYNTLAIASLRLGDFESCLNYQHLALEIARSRNDNKDIAASLNNIGNIHSMRGDYLKALPFHLEAVELSEEIHDQEGLATSYGNIGNVYYYLDKYEQAIEQYLFALEAFKKMDNAINVLILHINIASVYLEMEEPVEAIKQLEKAKELENVVNNPSFSAEIYLNLGKALSQNNDYEEATNVLLKAIDLKRQVGDNHGLANALIEFSFGQIRNNLTEGVEELLLEAEDLSKKLESKRFLRKIYQNLALLYKREKDFLKSLQFKELELIYLDSLRSEEQLKELEELQVRFETAKKEKEIELLQKEREVKSLQLEVTKRLAKETSILNQKKEQELILLNQASEIQSLELKRKEEQLKSNSLDFQKQKNELEIQQLESKLVKEELQAERSRRINQLIYSLTFVFVSSLVLFLLWKQRKTKNELETMGLKIDIFRSQLKPHFVFNVLNSIYAYILRKDRVEAANYLLRFSKVMRSALVSMNKEMNTLQEEIQLLQQIVELESIRLDRKINLCVSNNMNLEEIYIPSMLLQPIIENAILHGVETSDKQNEEIKVSFMKRNNLLTVSIINPWYSANNQNNFIADKEGKRFGLSITEERIKLINKKHKGSGGIDVRFKEDLNQVVVELALPLVN